MSIQIIDEALRLPLNARVDQRIPKKLLADQGAHSVSDRRHIHEGIEELIWLATLKPTTIGVDIYRDEIREYVEIAVVSAELREGANSQRIDELIHRSIPYPVVLITKTGEGCGVSLSHKRLSQAEAGKTVLERRVATGVTHLVEPTHELKGFVAALDLAAQPQRHLYGVYEGWITVVEAFQAARLTGCFSCHRSEEAIRLRRAALEEHSQLQRNLLVLQAQAAKEKQISRRVDLNLKIRHLRAALAALVTNLQ